MHRSKTIQLLLCVVLMAAAVACRAKDPNTTAGSAGVRVTDVTLGRSVGGDKAITDRTDTFKPNDTIYVSVATDGAAPSAILRAKWSFEDGQLVNESTRTIAPVNKERTEFHIAKPDGWPKGKYQVEILLDGKSVATKSFKVQ